MRDGRSRLAGGKRDPAVHGHRGLDAAGLHTGQLRLTGEGYAGHELHRAVRIAASGHGGQVVVSAATAARTNASNKLLLELGEHRLKDFDEPVPLFQLGRERFPPLNLPTNEEAARGKFVFEIVQPGSRSAASPTQKTPP